MSIRTHSLTVLPLLLLLVFLPAIHCVSAAGGDDDADCTFSEYMLSDSTSLKVRFTEISMTVIMEYDDEAWLGLGVSDDGNMIGGTAIIGSPSLEVNEYNPASRRLIGVQRVSSTGQTGTLINATFHLTEGANGSRLSYTQLLKDIDQDIPIEGDINFIWAVGSSNNLGIHAKRGSKRVCSKPCGGGGFVDSDGEKSSGSSSGQLDKGSLKTHGVIATIAFGAFMPFAMLASSFRKHCGFDIHNKKAWFVVHAVLMSTSAVLAIILFILAIVAKNKSKGTHFRRAHEIVGLLLLVVVFLQVIFAVFRPEKTHLRAQEEIKTKMQKKWECLRRLVLRRMNINAPKGAFGRKATR